LARGLQRIQDRGGLVAEADPARLATAVIAALQGGMLLARVRDDVAPLQDTLVSAVVQLHQWERKAATRNRRARQRVKEHPAR
jgi:TetR/AcrR family transcriptional repressor of nem operon